MTVFYCPLSTFSTLLGPDHLTSSDELLYEASLPLWYVTLVASPRLFAAYAWRGVVGKDFYLTMNALHSRARL